MKEIDFLPEWYKSGKRKSAAYRIQYVILGGIVAIMVVWNFFAAGAVSRAQAELLRITSGQGETQSDSRKFAQLKNQLADLQKRAALIVQIDSRIDVAAVLAELTFLIDRPIVLSKVELSAERFADARPPRGNPPAADRS